MNFSLHRIQLLFIRFFMEHWRRDIITASAFFAAFAFIPRLFHYPLIPASFILFALILLIGGMHFTARIFHEIHSPSSGMHYLHIPASRFEKFLANGILSLLLYPLFCVTLYYGATLFGNLLEPIMPSILNYPSIDISTLLPQDSIEKMCIRYPSLQAIFLVGSLVFKKHPTTKTLLSYLLVCIVFGIIQVTLASLILGDFSSISSDVMREKVSEFAQMFSNSTALNIIKYVLYTIGILFLWTVSYLKLTEKQV